jgi:hypothetical protein
LVVGREALAAAMLIAFGMARRILEMEWIGP